MIAAPPQLSSPEMILPGEPRVAGITLDLRCSRCAGRMADCLVCGNRGRPAELLLDLDFDGS